MGPVTETAGQVGPTSLYSIFAQGTKGKLSYWLFKNSPPASTSTGFNVLLNWGLYGTRSPLPIGSHRCVMRGWEKTRICV